MLAMPSRRRLRPDALPAVRALVLCGLLALAGCGGSDDGDGGEGAGAGTSVDSGADSAGGDRDVSSMATGEPEEDGSSTELTFDVPKAEFEEIDATIRFANVYSSAGKLQAVDVWWGTPAFGGEKAITVEPGTISEPVKVKVQSFDVDERRALITIVPKGVTEQNKVVNVIDEELDAGAQRIVAIGSETPVPGFSSVGGRTSMIYLNGEIAMAKPPAGKALVVVNTVGLAHLQPKDFVVPGVSGTCFELDNSINGGNAGSVHAIDPGRYDLALFDANTNCTAALGATPTTVAAGERYLLLGYGETEQTRTMLTVKL